MPRAHHPIPVIDLFAGPGGLGEGFSSLTIAGRNAFDVRLSIEKDPVAHQTLELRAFFRQFQSGHVPTAYYDFLRVRLSRQQLFHKFPREAARAAAEAWEIELSEQNAQTVGDRISELVSKDDPFVLIGGPPCQAYSLAGRSRNLGNKNYVPEDDHRQTLYVEYLQVIADHAPAVFVMENVKGLLSAKVTKQRVFERICEDLESPTKALRREGRRVRSGRQHAYRIHSVNRDDATGTLYSSGVQDFVVRSERHGVPQARHRLIIIGVRDDIGREPEPLSVKPFVAAAQVLDSLPRVRSGLSRETDSPKAWLDAIRGASERRWFRGAARTGGDEIQDLIQDTLAKLSPPRADRGAEFIPGHTWVDYEPEWFFDTKIEGVCNHSTRGHMVSDLHRYLYASCYAKIHGKSPELNDFPKDLYPDHRNVDAALGGGYFADRFRVQMRHRPSTTITSHIAKDGHYYIHYDPSQCRSLTVREAARLQTFPDNYFFCGGRTDQYHQVGNAVPPLMARDIARIVLDVLA